MNVTCLIASAISTATLTLVACTGEISGGGDEIPGEDCDEVAGSCQPLPMGSTTPSPTQPQPPRPWDPPSLGPWPGADAIVTADGDGDFSGNMSDLYYERGSGGAPDAMWAVQNGPGRMYKLTAGDDGLWHRVEAHALRFTDGSGDVDAEGVTRAEAGSTAIYVSTERDNSVPLVSRLSVLRYDTSNSGSTWNALQEWDLTNDLPAAYANAGFEALTWVPDSFLVAKGFVDETTGAPYRPADYPDHGTGLFFVGLEANGLVYVYALDHTDQSFTRIATFQGGHPEIETLMSLVFDRDTGYLWSGCDNECENQITVLAIDPAGAWMPRGKFLRPTTLENLNNEGIAFAPESACVGGRRAFFWIDDGDAHGHSLRTDAIPCGTFMP